VVGRRRAEKAKLAERVAARMSRRVGGNWDGHPWTGMDAMVTKLEWRGAHTVVVGRHGARPTIIRLFNYRHRYNSEFILQKCFMFIIACTLCYNTFFNLLY
jgi:hypothetical protein